MITDISTISTCKAVGRRGTERQALRNAKPVLLINNCETELMKAHGILNKSMRSNSQLRAAARDIFQHGAPLGGFLVSCEEGDPDSKRFKPLGNASEVLFRENLGRRHDRRLIAALNRAAGGERRNHSLS